VVKLSDDSKILEALKETLMGEYRKKKRELVRFERQFIRTPTHGLENEIFALGGYLKSIDWCLGEVEAQMNSQELPLGGAS
jgi:hypothetical protein